jgi:hypothetical protein
LRFIFEMLLLQHGIQVFDETEIEQALDAASAAK